MFFKGLYTAIVTPFDENLKVDWSALEHIIDLQIAAGVDGIVPLGTTGESPTLKDWEDEEIIKLVVKKAKGKCMVLAGAGSNDTMKSREYATTAEKLGADAVMLVNPYYNKPTQEGLFRHFSTVANAVSIPVLIYNIFGRSAVNLETSTLVRLIEACPNVKGVKEASGDLEQMKDVLAQVPKDFAVLSGDDVLTYDLTKMGGVGVVSVAANLIPAKMKQFVDACVSGDADAAVIASQLNAFFDMQFIETNPIPIKTAMAMKGLCKEVFRLPMCPMGETTRKKWADFLSKEGYI